jgi:rhamnosyl/mannosyltransferase
MKRVLQISKYMYPFIGGVEQVARDMSHALQKSGVEQVVICFNEDASDGKITCHKNETTSSFLDGIKIIRCGYIMKISSQSLSLVYYKELKNVMDNFKPDIIILHYPNPFVSYLLMKYQYRKFKLIIYWHLDITKQKFLGKIFHRQNVKLIRRADRIIGATPKHLNESNYSGYFGNKKYILPYMINENSLIMTQDEIKKSELIKKKYKGKILGFFIGRHVLYKGLKYLIEASKELGNYNIHFLIAGTGELTGKLKELAKDDKKIEFIGQINDSEKRKYLYACDIICFPSITKNEAFGLALAEGMYYKKPAVTFTIPGSGVNFVNLDGVTGIECPNSDSKAYAEALRKLSEDNLLREKYGQAARQRILDNFTIRRFEENVKKLVDSL